MRFVVGAMMVAFGLVGAWCVWAGLDWARRTWRVRGRLLRAEGVIVRVHRERRRRSAGSPGRGKFFQVANYPEIQFQTLGGEQRSFRSPVGDMGETSRYSPGQRMSVRYDPEGEVEPMLDSWAGLWLGPLMLSVAGLVFVGAAATIWLVFGARIVGG